MALSLNCAGVKGSTRVKVLSLAPYAPWNDVDEIGVISGILQVIFEREEDMSWHVVPSTSTDISS